MQFHIHVCHLQQLPCFYKIKANIDVLGIEITLQSVIYPIEYISLPLLVARFPINIKLLFGYIYF